MGITKQDFLEEADREEERLDRKFAKEHPDLAAQGWDRELWEAMLAAGVKND